ncbi:glycosyltransferase family 2 protein [Massilia scottii]|uniref:glycosyltransferase family 2 protein n=1 Tax=Massilia scottii TaxID=3057166 RepID=UPI002796CDB0|nr:glycosyltransferase [Massilia sp. CCM 9029]MDQ1833898.1 glycosyltransferase [Massilia sp. CCM 9029]
MIASWLPRIRTARCDVANLSVSRNIGICMAAGDVVAFIDDDAIPEPEWLTELAAAYQEPARNITPPSTSRSRRWET